MSRVRRVVLVVLLLVLIPASASAQGFFRWLGKLSGPGPFWGAGLEIRLKCLGLGEEGDAKPTNPGIVAVPSIRIPCGTTLDDRHTTIYLNVAGSIAENNPLFYGDVGQQEESTAVRLVTAGISADWTWAKAFDVGAGAGIAYFDGPRFDNFARVYVQPVRTAFRPLMLRGTATDNDGWLIVSANWQIFLGEIDGGDFGAPLDPLRESNEGIVAVGASIDVIRFVRRFKIGQPKP